MISGSSFSSLQLSVFFSESSICDYSLLCGLGLLTISLSLVRIGTLKTSYFSIASKSVDVTLTCFLPDSQ